MQTSLSYELRKATPADLDIVKELLRMEHLPIEDLPEGLEHFFVIKEEENIIGAIGLELYGTEALLRSLVVHSSFRNRSYASQLVSRILSYAADAGVQSMFLITTTAEKYFLEKGFSKVDREAVPLSISKTTEFSTLCPSSATVMVKEIK